MSLSSCGPPAVAKGHCSRGRGPSIYRLPPLSLAAHSEYVYMYSCRERSRVTCSIRTRKLSVFGQRAQVHCGGVQGRRAPHRIAIGAGRSRFSLAVRACARCLSGSATVRRAATLHKLARSRARSRALSTAVYNTQVRRLAPAQGTRGAFAPAHWLLHRGRSREDARCAPLSLPPFHDTCCRLPPCRCTVRAHSPARSPQVAAPLTRLSLSLSL